MARFARRILFIFHNSNSGPEGKSGAGFSPTRENRRGAQFFISRRESAAAREARQIFLCMFRIRAQMGNPDVDFSRRGEIQARCARAGFLYRVAEVWRRASRA